MENSNPFIVYKSSAGSGKTYTLVKEYLKIILVNPPKIRNILAITFTNAAAAEMKERIIQALGQLSDLAGMPETSYPDDVRPLLASLKKETALGGAEIIRHARLALTLILHNYGDFSVSTIDSFAHRVVRSFAFDLRIPLNFDVELDQEQLLSQAIDILVSRAGKEPQLTQLLVDYIESRTDDERSHYIEYDMARLAKTLMDEKGSIYVERLRDFSLEDFTRIRGNLLQGIVDFENKVQAIAQKAFSRIEQEQIAPEMFYRGKPGIGTWFAELAQGNIAAKIQPNSYVVKTVEEDKWVATKADEDTKSAIEAIIPELKNHYLAIEQLSHEELPWYKVHKLIIKHLFPMALLSELEKVLGSIKSENALLHISDFNKKISEIVMVESAPFIYERIGERYEHYMIDEFQDTSGLQWQNLLPLIHNALSSGHTNLLVGDGKQAIYRWRNGDVEQFASLPYLPDSIKAQDKPLWQASLERNYSHRSLDTNWRSLPEIIDFNNRFFGFVKEMLPDSLKSIYEGHEQKKHPQKQGGYVQIDFVEDGSEGEPGYTENTHQHILDTIYQLESLGHPLNDITILCRSNGEASQTARFLLERGISVISSESLLLSQSSKVNFMVAVMKLANHADDQVSITELLQFLVKNGTLSVNLHDAIQEVTSMAHPATGEKKQQQITAGVLEQYLHQNGIAFSFLNSRHLSIYELGEAIVREFFGGQPPDPFIAFFMDVLHEYNNRFVSSLPDFLEWWPENAGKYSVVVPEGINAVQVMTIHKSKGLQFPVVIYPFADKKYARPGKEGEWVDIGGIEKAQPLPVAWLGISSAMEGTPYEDLWLKEQAKTLLDLLNVSYVAFTRAVKKLFIVTRHHARGKYSDKNFAGFLQQFLAQEGLWDDAEPTYTFGKNAALKKEKPIATESEEKNKGQKNETERSIFEHYISTARSDKTAIRSRQLETQQEENTAIERGSRFHDIMAGIHRAEDVQKVLAKMEVKGELEATEVKALQEKITAMLSHSLMAPWYHDDVEGRNECGMYNSQGKYFRADRVVFDEKQIVIIDYKTGEEHPSHLRQIRHYASIINDMGYHSTTCLLAYPNLGKVVQV